MAAQFERPLDKVEALQNPRTAIMTVDQVHPESLAVVYSAPNKDISDKVQSTPFIVLACYCQLFLFLRRIVRRR